MVATLKILLCQPAHFRIPKREGVAKLELAFEQCVLKQLVHIHVIPAKLSPPPSPVKPRMLFEKLPQ